MTSFVTNISSWRNYAVKQIKINNALFRAACRKKAGARTDGRTNRLSFHRMDAVMRTSPTEFSVNLPSSVDPASAIYCESIALTRPLRRSAARSSATNNTSQQGLITCCRWQSINHTVNFAAARSVFVASTRSYVVWEMDDRRVEKENSNSIHSTGRSSRRYFRDIEASVGFASEETGRNESLWQSDRVPRQFRVCRDYR